MALRLTNTLTGEKEEFRPLHPPRVTMYVCGVTVYDDCHIGHVRGAVVFDCFRRYLESDRYRYRVIHVRNITDVDDKIIDRARGLTPAGLKERAQLVAEHFTRRFQSDFARLGLLAPHHEPKATEFIPKMIRFIQILLEKGVAYEGSDGVYYSVRKISPYGELSHQRLDQMLVGVRAEAGEGPGGGKKDPLDFALWKKGKPPAPRSLGEGGEEPSWESPWGPGRPGWHIECSTMSTDLLGDTFDIHGGGQDLIFPHHENERAQALGAGKPFARVWLHNGLLTINGQKMSKSLGNIVTIPEVLRRHSADVLRLFYLSAHYRSPQDFTWERLDEAAHAYERLNGFLVRSRLYALARTNSPRTPVEGITQIETEFREAMEDDLNTPRALACLHKLAIDQAQATAAIKLEELGKVLGFFQTVERMNPEVEKLVKERDFARKGKDFTTSDKIRRQLNQMGYIVEDTTGKTIVRKRV